MAGMFQNLPAILRRQGFNLMQDFGDTHEEKLIPLATKNKPDRKRRTFDLPVPVSHEIRDRQIYYQVDKDWHYRKEERRWIATNDKSGWQRVTRKNNRWTSETFYIR